MKAMLRVTCLLAAFWSAAVSAQPVETPLGDYAYDASGNVSSIGPDADGLTNYYDYDSARRLIRFVRKNDSTGATVLTETYEYDAFGNQTKRTVNGSAVTSLPANAATNRLSGATYDKAGNVLSYANVTYVHDPVGTLTQKTGSWGTAFYLYGPDDERIAIEGPDHTWRYTLRDFNGKVLREWGSGSWNGPLNWAEDYIYGNGQLVAGVRPESQGGIRHFHRDHLGTPRYITGPNASILYARHDYYPFGAEITDPAQELALEFDTPEPMKFTGHERDFNGSFSTPLDYMHARYYSPQAGRFLAVDPIRGNRRSTQSWNRYSYVRNAPLSLVDPDGLEPLDPTMRSFFENHYMTDLSGVQVHGGFFARLLANRQDAITFGNHVFFSRSGWDKYKSVHRAGASSGAVEDGIALTGHEITHTLQARPIGTFTFVLRYLAQWVSVGFRYSRIPYEDDAEREEDTIRSMLQADPALQQSIADGTYVPPQEPQEETSWDPGPTGGSMLRPLLRRYWIRPHDVNDPFRGTGFCDASNVCH